MASKTAPAHIMPPLPLRPALINGAHVNAPATLHSVRVQIYAALAAPPAVRSAGQPTLGTLQQHHKLIIFYLSSSFKLFLFLYLLSRTHAGG